MNKNVYYNNSLSTTNPPKMCVCVCVSKRKSNEWGGHILNLNVRGLFLESSCPNWPLSLLPHECTCPLPVNINVCMAPHEISSMSAASGQSISRGAKICNSILKIYVEEKKVHDASRYLFFFDATQSEFTMGSVTPTIDCHFFVVLFCNFFLTARKEENKLNAMS